MPERPPREPAPVGLRFVFVADDCRRNVPALPPGEHRAILQVDVLAVQAKGRIEAAELVEHLPPQQEEAAEHPVGLDGLLRIGLVEVVMVLEVDDLAKGRPANEGAADGGEAAMPQRSRPAMNARRAATAPGSATASGFATTTASPPVRASPRLTLAEKPSGRGFSSASTPGGTEPGTFAITSSSST